jgi:hypothetical protein
METVVSIVALVGLMGVLSAILGRWMTRKKGALWIWDHSTMLGWGLIGVGVGLILSGFLFDRSGTSMTTKLGLGSMLLFAGLWMIW